MFDVTSSIIISNSTIQLTDTIPFAILNDFFTLRQVLYHGLLFHMQSHTEHSHSARGIVSLSNVSK